MDTDLFFLYECVAPAACVLGLLMMACVTVVDAIRARRDARHLVAPVAPVVHYGHLRTVALAAEQQAWEARRDAARAQLDTLLRRAS